VSGSVSPVTELERELLGPDGISDGYRLACQTAVLGSIKGYLPPASLIVGQRLQVAGTEAEVPFDPPVEECMVAAAPASMDDPRSDWERLVAELGRACDQRVRRADIMALRRLSHILRDSGWKIRVSVRDDEAIDFRSPDKGPLGLAVDLGTTKVAAYLVDLENGKTMASEGMVNPQRAWGEDVMSRISHAMREGGERLRQVVIEGLNELITKLCPEPETIVEVTLVGNTAMHHLFLELPVSQLGLAPYLPAVKRSLDVKARDLGLNIAPGGYVYVLPSVAGFIGSDHVAMVLATGIDETDKTVLGLDIGTNTEIALVHRGKIRSTSCASGPAFEGGHIEHGMAAARGAIERVRMGDSGVEFQTVDGVSPMGLCGSGVLDAIAELYRLGFITPRGRLESGSGVREAGTTREFVLVPGDASETGEDITVTQKDIREIQLAKAAIRTGIDTLLEEMGIDWEEVEEVVIAGAFGSSVNPASAVAIGMFPPIGLEQFTVVGNAAGTGCTLCLTSRSARAKAEEIARQIGYLELMTHPRFTTRFARAMYFPTGFTSDQEEEGKSQC
jgi:uncharacterized 2Fe-2S/4Fe-4S cluster protein (DUF4445 family)